MYLVTHLAVFLITLIIYQDNVTEVHERARKVLELTWRTTSLRAGWRRDKKSDGGDIIESRRGASRKIFKLTVSLLLEQRD
jgi:hypothetical protein